jgi:Common central domain of tyrosinase
MIDRKSAFELAAEEQDRFLRVITTMNSGQDPTLYAQFVGIHADMRHRMHSSMGGGAVGRQRFLPWHRDFLLKFETAMQHIDPRAFIPYWHWSIDRALPPWLGSFDFTVIVPATDMSAPQIVNVLRHLQLDALPSDVQIAHLEMNTVMNYTQFTATLESYHNTVHALVGGTMNDIMISPCDPLFWMHHAEVDRICSIWQADPANQAKGPSLSPIHALLDPWDPDTVATVASITTLGYDYI